MRVDGRFDQKPWSIDGRRDPPSRRARGGRRDGLVRPRRRRARLLPVGDQPADRDARAGRRPAAARAAGRTAAGDADRGRAAAPPPRAPGLGGDAGGRGRPPRARRGRGRARCASARSRASACACCRARCGATSSAGRTSRCGSIEAGYDEELLALLERGELDLAFVIENDDPAFERVHVLSDPYVLLAPAGSELARSDRPIRPREIAAAAADRLPQRRRGRRAVPPLARARARDRLSLRRGRHRPGPRRRGDRLHRRAAARRGREPGRRRARGRGHPAAPDHDRLAHRPDAHAGGAGVRRDRDGDRGRDRRGLRSGRDEPHHATRETTPMRLLTVVGNRPQFIKSAPLSVALREAGSRRSSSTRASTGTPALSAVFFEELGLAEPDVALDLRTSDVATIEAALRRVVADVEPDAVLVYGDTNSTLAGRAGRRRAFPSRTSRRACGAATSRCRRSATGSRSTRSRRILFAPDERSAATLRSEGVGGEIHVVGDVMADAAARFAPLARERSRILDDARARAGRLRARDRPPRGERAAGAAAADRGRPRPLATSRRAPRAPADAERAGRARRSRCRRRSR